MAQGHCKKSISTHLRASIGAPYSLSTAKIYHNLTLFGRLLEKLSNHPLDGTHPEPVSSIDRRSSPNRLFDEVPEEVWLWQIELLYASLGDNAAVVGSHHQPSIFLDLHFIVNDGTHRSAVHRRGHVSSDLKQVK